MHGILRPTTQLVDLFSSLTGNLPIGAISGFVLIVLDLINPDDKQKYIKKMTTLAKQGYENYVRYFENAKDSQCGIPNKTDVLNYVADCFSHHKIPTVEGLQSQANASSEEATRMMFYLEQSWCADTEYINANRLLECIQHHEILKRDLSCMREYTDDQVKALENKISSLLTLISSPTNEFTKYINSLNSFKPFYGKLYDYLSPNVPFFGREHEIDCLNNFCNDNRVLLWWAITGYGGIGKSRLVYEFCRSMIDKGWRCAFLSKTDLERIASFSDWHYPNNLLLVIDYVAHHGQTIGKWLEELSSKSHSYVSKIRLLFIERLNFISSNPITKSSIGSSFPAAWIREIQRGIGDVSLLEYFCYSKDLIQLEPLNDNILRQIIIGTVSSLGINPIIDTEVHQLINKLKEFDPDLKRPLYLLFLLQMRIDMPMQPTPSSFTDLSDYICNKELKRIQNVMGEGAPEEVAEILLIFSIITHPFSFDDPNLHNLAFIEQLIKNSLNSNYTPQMLKSNLQRLWGIDDGSCIIAPFFPSLIGEYFVLRSFRSKQDLISPVLQSAWVYSPRDTTIFLERVLTEFFEFSSCCDFDGWSGMDIGLFQEPQVDDITTIAYYANLLVDLSAATKSRNNALHVVKVLNRYYIQHHTSLEIWICYAKALVNLMLKPITSESDYDLSDTIESDFDIVTNLKYMASRTDAPLSVKIEYARSLYTYGQHISTSLFSHLYIDVLYSIADEIEYLWKNNPEFEIAIRYIKILYHFCLPFELIDDEALMCKICDLIEKYDITTETATILIEMITNLGLEYHDKEQLLQDINRLTKLSAAFNSDSNIANQCLYSIQQLKSIRSD